MIKIIKITILTVLTVLLFGCGNKNKSIILNYYDFGPQAMSYETLGYSWYEWESHGDGKNEDNIKIVIFDGSLEKAQQKYKDNRDTPVDYRFISKLDALDYLEKNIKEVTQNKELLDISNKLKETKKRILGNQNVH